jgi:hypothetical protein
MKGVVARAYSQIAELVGSTSEESQLQVGFGYASPALALLALMRLGRASLLSQPLS